MLTSRSSHFVGHLCRCLTRDFSVATTSCAPRGSTTRVPGGTMPEQSTVSHVPELANDTQPTKLTTVTQSAIKLTQTDVPTDPVAIDLTSSGTQYLKPLPEGSTEAKELYQILVTSPPEVVMELVSSQHEQMNKVHYALAMKSLFRSALGLSADELEHFRKDVQHQQGFQVLCALVALKGPHYDATVTADMLRFMLMLGLESDHPAVQVYLQLIKYQLNDIGLDALVRLMHSLSFLAMTSQTEVIQQAIRVLVNLRANQIPALNTWQKVTLLEHCAGILEASTLNLVLTQLMDDPGDLSVKLATVILHSLLQIDIEALKETPVIDSVADVIVFCLQRLHKDDGQTITKMATMDILGVLESLRVLGICDVDLFNDVGSRFVSENETLEHVLIVLACFSEHRFHHAQLVMAFKKRLHSAAIAGFSDRQVMNVLRVLADTSQPNETLNPKTRPVTEQMLIEQLCTRLLQFAEDLSSGERQQCSVDMAVLGETRKMMTSEVPSLLKDIYQTTLSGSLSDDHYQRHEKKTIVIGRALTLAIDHRQSLAFPQDNAIAHIIDHVLFINADGSVPSDQDNMQINRLGNGLQPVAVLVPPITCFHSNTSQLRGPALLCGRILQEAGYMVMMINHVEWSQMAEPDMVPYLTRRVQTVACDQNLHML